MLIFMQINNQNLSSTNFFYKFKISKKNFEIGEKRMYAILNLTQLSKLSTIDGFSKKKRKCID